MSDDRPHAGMTDAELRGAMRTYAWGLALLATDYSTPPDPATLAVGAETIAALQAEIAHRQGESA